MWSFVLLTITLFDRVNNTKFECDDSNKLGLCFYGVIYVLYASDYVPLSGCIFMCLLMKTQSCCGVFLFLESC